MIFYKRLILAISLSIIPAKSFASPLDGAWSGHYTCEQGNTAFDLQISSSNQTHLKALFYFHPINSNGFLSLIIPTVPKGCFLMQGYLNAASSTVYLLPTTWLLQPPGFVTVSLQGQLLNNDNISGTVDGPGCTSFLLTRGDDNSERPAPCLASD